MSAPQDEDEMHYSTGIPSKYPGDYELFKTFSSFSKMKNWISKNYNMDIDKKQLKAPENLKRDKIVCTCYSEFCLTIFAKR